MPNNSVRVNEGRSGNVVHGADSAVDRNVAPSVLDGAEHGAADLSSGLSLDDKVSRYGAVELECDSSRNGERADDHPAYCEVLVEYVVSVDLPGLLAHATTLRRLCDRVSTVVAVVERP